MKQPQAAFSTNKKPGPRLPLTLSSHLEDVDFTDDLAVMSATLSHLQEKYDWPWKQFCTEKTGLYINPKRTKVMHVEAPSIERNYSASMISPISKALLVVTKVPINTWRPTLTKPQLGREKEAGQKKSRRITAMKDLEESNIAWSAGQRSVQGREAKFYCSLLSQPRWRSWVSEWLDINSFLSCEKATRPQDAN